MQLFSPWLLSLSPLSLSLSLSLYIYVYIYIFWYIFLLESSKIMGNINPKFLFQSLREKYPRTEFFLVRIFMYSVRLQQDNDRKKPRIWTLFMQWILSYMLLVSHVNKEGLISTTRKKLLIWFETNDLGRFCFSGNRSNNWDYNL